MPLSENSQVNPNSPGKNKLNTIDKVDGLILADRLVIISRGFHNRSVALGLTQTISGDDLRVIREISCDARVKRV